MPARQESASPASQTPIAPASSHSRSPPGSARHSVSCRCDCALTGRRYSGEWQPHRSSKHQQARSRPAAMPRTLQHPPAHGQPFRQIPSTLRRTSSRSVTIGCSRYPWNNSQRPDQHKKPANSPTCYLREAVLTCRPCQNPSGLAAYHSGNLRERSPRKSKCTHEQQML